MLNLRKTYGNFGGRTRKSPRISENFINASNPFLRSLSDFETFGKLRKQFKSIFQKILWFFKKFSENLWKLSEVFGNLRKFSENFGNGSKVIFRCFCDFLNYRKIFGNLRKCSEIFGNDFRMWSEMFVMVRRSWKLSLRSPQMDPSKMLRARNNGKVEWNTTRCILPVAYRRICNGNPGLWLAVFFKAWDKEWYSMWAERCKVN